METLKQKLTSRIAQLMARWLNKASIGLGGIFGVDLAMGDATANEIAGVIISAGIFAATEAWDLYIHRKETGGVLKPAGASNQKENT